MRQAPPFPRDPLDTVIRKLVAESLTPVPPASRAVAVDIDDLAYVVAHLREAAACASRGRAAPPLSAETASAAARLETVIRGRAA